MSSVDNLQLAGTIVGLTAACYGGARLTLRTWLRTIGSRRDLTRRLNALACGATYEYVADLLGQPAFRRPLSEMEECTWRMKHGWVCGLVSDRSLLAFAITVTDPKFRFDCSILTFGQLPAILGLTTLGATPDPESAQVSVGARRFYMKQYHYFGNPGRLPAVSAGVQRPRHWRFQHFGGGPDASRNCGVGRGQGENHREHDRGLHTHEQRLRTALELARGRHGLRPHPPLVARPTLPRSGNSPRCLGWAGRWFPLWKAASRVFRVTDAGS